MNKNNNYKEPFAISIMLAICFLLGAYIGYLKYQDMMLTTVQFCAHIFIWALLCLIPAIFFAIIGFCNLPKSANATKESNPLPSCPFCSGKAELRHERIPDGHVSYQVAYVRCTACGCRTPDFTIDGYYGSTETEADAIAAWSKRAK